ncbi:protein-L-isoaspartate and D-aspartate O-methyltransferase [Thioflavicoccus mobilis 8321]|uniref:Protein-L-isoaspartate O-methyltransferase n=1 Tax=Thioflavicoccus mobilis 8321 TaxID=765912 RepID=L0GXZ5_9GAMM|nr:protein-L-isoaspartate(D-aspartate) O-methyltransferase [Thioflavicoccus mobilis]AGA91628.1 protein-L-isoaspartate and D-aspartate O-methyltransferase [Thioflavicoccus mobilis 8321]
MLSILMRNGFGTLAATYRGPVLLSADQTDGGPGLGRSEPDESAERDALIREIERGVFETQFALGTDHLDPAVLAAVRAVPRHAFVPSELRQQAYRDHPLPIGGGQTISQPYIVAIMSHLLGVGPGDRVFELGTGSGYQAAVLAEMGVEVYTVEIVPEHAERSARLLAELGYERVQVRVDDGYLGWPEAAPFAGIIATAAADHIPRPLIDQLAAGGRLVMPVGGDGRIQQLTLIEKLPDGDLHQRTILPVRFVPVTGEYVHSE